MPSHLLHFLHRCMILAARDNCVTVIKHGLSNRMYICQLKKGLFMRSQTTKKSDLSMSTSD